MLYQYSNIIIWKQHLAFTSCEHQWWFPLYFIYILMCYTIILHSFTSDLLLCGAIVIWFMGSLEKQVPPLRLLQSQHFKHIKRGPYFFRDLKNFQTHVERAARIWGTWKEDNKWDERSLSEMYVSIRNLFNFETVKKARKSKRLEQQRWETVYWKLKKRKFRLVGEEEEQQQ